MLHYQKKAINSINNQFRTVNNKAKNNKIKRNKYH